MVERRFLALCYAYPPIALPEAALAAKRFANLPGWQVDVIAAAPFHRSIPVDRELVAYAEAAVRGVRRVAPPVQALWPLLARAGRAPDAFRWLNGQAIKAAGELGLSNYACMLSWSQYHSVHLAALAIKLKHPNLPWCAHFSDPWIDNPFARLSGRALRINGALERKVFERADRLMFTTPETVDLVMRKYPIDWRNKVRVIPHGFEPALYPTADSARRGPPWLLRYIGNFYGDRTPEPLYRALATALARRPSLATSIVVEIVGSFERGLRQGPAPGQLPEGLVRLRPPVGYRESLALMRASDILLVLDAPGRTSVFLPSKLVDYLGAGRTIVGLTPPGASQRVLRETGHPAADPADADAGAAILLQAVDNLENGSDDAANRTEPSAYSAAHTGAMLDSVLREIVH